MQCSKIEGQYYWRLFARLEFSPGKLLDPEPVSVKNHRRVQAVVPNFEQNCRVDKWNLCAGLPKRWIVELTIAWLNRCRRLAKD